MFDVELSTRSHNTFNQFGTSQHRENRSQIQNFMQNKLSENIIDCHLKKSQRLVNGWSIERKIWTSFHWKCECVFVFISSSFFIFSFSFYFNGMDYGVYLWWFIKYMMLRKTFLSLLKSGKRSHQKKSGKRFFFPPLLTCIFHHTKRKKTFFVWTKHNSLNAISSLHNNVIKSKVSVQDLLIALGRGEEGEAKKGHTGAF